MFVNCLIYNLMQQHRVVNNTPVFKDSSFVGEENFGFSDLSAVQNTMVFIFFPMKVFNIFSFVVY